ncbi:MAG: phage portal protein [Enhydrobacter sp.]|nr:phage portal protein [Enhydrobacter sp.]
MAGWLRSLFGGERKGVTDITALLDVGSQTAAGIMASPTRAMRCVPVYAGVRVISETVGSLPLHLYKRRGDGGKDRASNHKLYRLLHDRPNAWTSATEFIMQLQKDALLEGGGYALANRSGDRIVELIRLPASTVRMETEAATMEPKYVVTLRDGKQRTYPWQDILHVPALDGLSPVKQASEAIGLCMAMESHAARLFGRGARPSGVLKLKSKLSDPAYERLKKSWSANHGGDGSGGTAILEDGVDWQQLTLTCVDAQFLELRSFQVVEIARALRVPPTLLMDFGRATWGNAAEMAQNFLTYGVMPWLKLWQGAITRLLPEEERADYFAEFLVDDLVKADIAARFTAYAQAVTNGILNPNEVRAMENRAPYEGGEEFRLPMNTEAPLQTEPTPRPRPKPRAVA